MYYIFLRMVKEFAAVNNTGQIKRLLKVLGQDFSLSQNSHARKGGLIGLAAIAIALGKVLLVSVIINVLFYLNEVNHRIQVFMQMN